MANTNNNTSGAVARGRPSLAQTKGQTSQRFAGPAVNGVVDNVSLMWNNFSMRNLGAIDELDKRRSQSKTYTTPLDVENDSYAKEFVTTFYSPDTIFTYVDKIENELINNEETIGVHYYNLVPNQISFDQFWLRFFYRTSLDTINREMKRQKLQSMKSLRNLGVESSAATSSRACRLSSSSSSMLCLSSTSNIAPARSLLQRTGSLFNLSQNSGVGGIDGKGLGGTLERQGSRGNKILERQGSRGNKILERQGSRGNKILERQGSVGKKAYERRSSNGTVSLSSAGSDDIHYDNSAYGDGNCDSEREEDTAQILNLYGLRRQEYVQT